MGSISYRMSYLQIRTTCSMYMTVHNSNRICCFGIIAHKKGNAEIMFFFLLRTRRICGQVNHKETCTNPQIVSLHQQKHSQRHHTTHNLYTSYPSHVSQQKHVQMYKQNMYKRQTANGNATQTHRHIRVLLGFPFLISN